MHPLRRGRKTKEPDDGLRTCRPRKRSRPAPDSKVDQIRDQTGPEFPCSLRRRLQCGNAHRSKNSTGALLGETLQVHESDSIAKVALNPSASGLLPIDARTVSLPWG